jgi:hypothetical protein
LSGALYALIFFWSMITDATKNPMPDKMFIIIPSNGFTMNDLLILSMNYCLSSGFMSISFTKLLSIIKFIASAKFQNGSSVNTYLKILNTIPNSVNAPSKVPTKFGRNKPISKKMTPLYLNALLAF